MFLIRRFSNLATSLARFLAVFPAAGLLGLSLFIFAACTPKSSPKSSQGDGADKNSNLSPEEQIQARVQVQGARVFAMRCAMCHGERADGKGPMAGSMNPPPANLASGVLKRGDTEEALFNTVTRGIPSAGMPSFAVFTEQDRRAVVKYVLALRSQSGASQGAGSK
jgi:mono/diheme cytochrome c family protein